MIDAESTDAYAMTASDKSPIEMTLVTAEDCGLCAHAREVLASVGRDLPLQIREVDLESAEGQALGGEVPLVFPPILLRDGEVVSYGRLSERRLRKELTDA